MFQKMWQKMGEILATLIGGVTGTTIAWRLRFKRLGMMTGFLLGAMIGRSSVSLKNIFLGGSKNRVGPRTTEEEYKYTTKTGATGTYHRRLPAAKEWARLAGLDLDTAALCRMIASEEGSSAPIYWLCVAEAAIIQARIDGQSVYELLVDGTRTPVARGYFGEQRTRFASTGEDPNEQHLTAARAAMAGTQITHGAHRWVSLATMDRGSQKGTSLKNAKALLDSWSDLEWVGPIDGIDPYHLMMMRRVSPGQPRDIQTMYAIVDDGRQRYGIKVA